LNRTSIRQSQALLVSINISIYKIIKNVKNDHLDPSAYILTYDICWFSFLLSHNFNFHCELGFVFTWLRHYVGVPRFAHFAIRLQVVCEESVQPLIALSALRFENKLDARGVACRGDFHLTPATVDERIKQQKHFRLQTHNSEVIRDVFLCKAIEQLLLMKFLIYSDSLTHNWRIFS
jgi:hypothetical protein